VSSGLDGWISASPWPQRLATRALIELARRPRGAALLARLGPFAQLGGSLRGLAHYDDPAVSRRLGWDAAVVVSRGRELRHGEGRP
jgi:hypothetical protein